MLAAVTLTYSNHFQNGFHFDDYIAVTGNVFIRNLGNIPKFFTDANTQTSLPQNRLWRPLVSTTLAIDYWLGGGYKPFFFQLSTFLWFLAQLVFMYALFRAVLNRARPGPANDWIAWLAVALYGLHPAMAETVNYVYQRGDVLSTVGAVAGLALYIRFPGQRRFGLYLAPVVLGLLAKTPAAVFAGLLLFYIWFFEEELSFRGLVAAVRRSAVSIVVCGALAVLQLWMTAKSYTPGGSSAYEYVITQPYVALRYVRTFFLPLYLTVDTDLRPFHSMLSPGALGGMLFLVALFCVAYVTAKRSDTRPISFGLIWFILALIPTAVVPLAEVENDHRMYFPFVGLVLAVTWAGALAVMHWRVPDPVRRAVAPASACLLILCAMGTHERNEVWRTDESLWLDATVKSPANGRALMNYGLTQMSKGDYFTALSWFEKADTFSPNYYFLEINLAIANGGLNRDTEAERHFRRAIALAPKEELPYFYYGRWLKDHGRSDEAAQALKSAVALNPTEIDARYLLMQVLFERQEWAALREIALGTLQLAPNDPKAQKYLADASR